MDAAAQGILQIGAWSADPLKGTLVRGTECVRVDARCMRLLVCLASHAGRPVSVEKLLDEVWEGVVVSQDSVYQAVATLRRQLGDDPKNPTYIATVPRLGYRLVAEVASLPPVGAMIAPGSLDAVPIAVGAATPGKSHGSLRVGAAAALVVALLAGGLLLYARHSDPASAPRTVAVMPFSDLTSQAMNEEYFADGMTEELIDRLSHVPGLSVSAAASSFSLKGKELSSTEAGKALNVSYVLDGSVRESDTTMRISARLARVQDGVVVWSQSYDRPLADKLMVQEDIAREVAAALAASVKP